MAEIAGVARAAGGQAENHADEMDDEEFCRIVAGLVKDCEQYREEQAPNRTRAMEYYDGTMSDTLPNDGKSGVVSRDVRGEIKKVIPSIVRVILGGDRIVEYQPVSGEDEQSAEQATDYINHLAFPESQGPQAVHDAIFDSILLRNGVLKWWQEEKIDTKVSKHSGLDDYAFSQLVSDDAVDVLAHTPSSAAVDNVIQLFHDVTIRRKIKKSRARMAAVPLDNFLIHPDAISMEDSPIIGENLRMRRSDLVAMGYDRDRVDDMPIAGSTRQKDEEETTRRRDLSNKEQILAKSMEEVDYYELLVRIDYDNDGIAELRRIVFAGGLTEEDLLENEPWDEINYADVVCERRPHQWEGNATSDDAMEIQRIKTVLLRQTLDNLYWQNNLQDIVQEGAISNPEAVANPKFGLTIRVLPGTDVRTVMTTRNVPFVAEKSFAMLTYLDQELHDRTGISDASGGLSPDALQNVTAKASAMMEQAGIGQTEMMVRTIADCLKPAFRGLLKLIIQHQDKPRTVRLRGKWVNFDPRTWNVDMDASVNTGLGAGTRERDMMMMQVVTGMQEKLLTALGPDNNPYVKPNQVYNGVTKLVEASGLKAVDQYFTNPSPEELQMLAQQKAQQKTPEQQKTEGAIQIEQAKGQTALQLADKKMQVEANKEREQRDADIVIKQAELEKENERAMHEALIKEQSAAADREMEMAKIASQERIAIAKIEADAALAREKMEHEMMQAEMARQDSMMQAQQAASQPQEETVAPSESPIDIALRLMEGMSKTSRPKRVVRDENGLVVGIE